MEKRSSWMFLREIYSILSMLSPMVVWEEEYGLHQQLMPRPIESILRRVTPPVISFPVQRVNQTPPHSWFSTRQIYRSLPIGKYRNHRVHLITTLEQHQRSLQPRL